MRTKLAIIGILSSVLLSACGNGSDAGDPPPLPSSLIIISGDGQSGTVGAPLAQPLVVQVTSEAGDPVTSALVTFVVGSGGGQLSADTVRSDANGQASTILQLGTVAGTANTHVSATVTGVAPVGFTATAHAGPPAQAILAAGDSQVGQIGQQLAQPLVVSVRDGYGNPDSGVAVRWQVSVGGGTVAAELSTTDGAGQTSMRWTLGNSAGPQSLSATAGDASATAVTGSATAVDIAITGIAPDTLVEGDTVVISGRGFSPELAQNIVLISGLVGTVYQATPTALRVGVPQADCRPAHRTAVDLRVGSVQLPADSVLVRPVHRLNLAVGQQMILRGPADLCLQFGASTAEESYLVGMQSVSEDVTAITPVVLTSERGAGTAPTTSMPRTATRPAIGGPPRRLSKGMLQHQQARQASAAFLDRTLEQLKRLPAAGRLRSAGRAPAMVSMSATVGDTQTVNVIDIRAPNGCTGFTPITTVTRVVTAHASWLEDVANPANGLTLSNLQDLANQFEDRILPVDSAEFGAATDFDGNGRTIMVVTKEINRSDPSVTGFVTAADFYSRTACPSSNEGEYFYMMAADPQSLYRPYSGVDDVMSFTPVTLAHEYVHTLQVGRRMAQGVQLQSGWELEGQANLADEIVGWTYDGQSAGQEYGLAIALNDDLTGPDWHGLGFYEVMAYFGYDFSSDAGARVTGAPEECLWIARRGPPCGGNLTYGAGWLILRWLTDQYASRYPGGERAIQRSLIDNNASGLHSLELIAGVRADTLLAQWAAMLYTDGRNIPQLQPELSVASWDLYDIWYGTDELGPLSPLARLTPTERGFETFADSFRVVSASARYTVVKGAGHPATSIKARSAGGAELPGSMQLWVVRME